MTIEIGNKVRVIAKRGRAANKPLGVVTGFFERKGERWAYVGIDLIRAPLAAWPVKKLEVIETRPCVCGGTITYSSGECDQNCENPSVFGA